MKRHLATLTAGLLIIGIATLIIGVSTAGAAGSPWERLQALEATLAELVSSNDQANGRLDTLEAQAASQQSQITRLRERVTCLERQRGYHRIGTMPTYCRKAVVYQ